MPKAFQKVYTKLVQITKATVSLRAENVGNDEMAVGIFHALGSGLPHYAH